MLHKNSKTQQEFYISNTILLYNQSTLDLMCNKIFTSEVKTYKTKQRVHGNGEILLVNHRSKIPGYDQTTWFSKKAITNILSLNNITK